MAEKNRTVEVRLKRIEFTTKGAGGSRARTEHSLACTLHWPKAGTQAKTYARIVEMDGMARDYGEGDWIDAVLFRDTLQPPTAVTFQLSVPLASEAVSKAVGAILKAAFAAAGDVAASLSPTKAAGKVAAAPFDAWASTMTNRSAAVLGQATLPLDDELLAAGGERIVPLRATREITRSVPGSGRSAAPRTRRVAAKGDEVARLVLEIVPR